MIAFIDDYGIDDDIYYNSIIIFCNFALYFI